MNDNKIVVISVIRPSYERYVAITWDMKRNEMVDNKAKVWYVSSHGDIRTYTSNCYEHTQSSFFDVMSHSVYVGDSMQDVEDHMSIFMLSVEKNHSMSELVVDIEKNHSMSDLIVNIKKQGV